MALVDLDKLNSLVEQHYLSVQKHPTEDVLIYNYTQKAQYDRYWTDETLMCRGLIVRPDGTLVARPFVKFMNYEEHQGPLPLEPFKVTEKLDGSLGILYFVGNTPYLATRGSFTSEQAKRGTEILHTKYDNFHFKDYCTYLFEIIFKGNRIIVDYGEMEDIVLLAVIHTDTGQEYDIHNMPYEVTWPFPVAKHYDRVSDITSLRELEEANKEGFVIRFQSGLRLKIKFAEYVRLHRLLTQINARVIWDLLRNNQPFDDLLERVPDEFYTWVSKTRHDLLAQYGLIEAHCQMMAHSVQHLPARKDQAALIVKEQYSGVIFSMLDHKNYQEAIWKVLRPQAEKPFKEDEA